MSDTPKEQNINLTKPKRPNWYFLRAIGVVIIQSIILTIPAILIGIFVFESPIETFMNPNNVDFRQLIAALFMATLFGASILTSLLILASGFDTAGMMGVANWCFGLKAHAKETSEWYVAKRENEQYKKYLRLKEHYEDRGE